MTNGLNKTVGLIGAGVAGATILGGSAAYLATRKSKKRRKKTRRKSYKKHYRRRKQRKPYTAGKRKDTSHRRIRFTKRGQPYIILSTGKAKFIKMKSVRHSRRRKGGRY